MQVQQMAVQPLLCHFKELSPYISVAQILHGTNKGASQQVHLYFGCTFHLPLM